MELTLSLPELYPLQREIIDHPAKRKVVNAGRRAGKTQMGAVYAIESMLAGRKVLLSSTSQDQADIFWSRIKAWAAPIIPYAYKNETKRILEFNGGRIRVKTGSDADVLRGEDADDLILDECSRLNPLAWFEVGAPMLADRDGTAVFITTPNRKNWFYLLYLKAKADASGRYKAWHFTTMANPYLNKVALSDLVSDMTEESYKQEILAEFLESGGEVFRNIDKCAILKPAMPYSGEFVFGVDWAQKHDYTVITVFDAKSRQMVAMDRFNGISWSLQRGRLRALYDLWNPKVIWAESNSIGSPNIEALQQEGLPVMGFETTAASKPPLIENLALSIERNEIQLLDDGILTGELSAYEREISPNTGRSKFGAPEGMHDDTVIATALGVWAMDNQHQLTSDTLRPALADLFTRR